MKQLALYCGDGVSKKGVRYLHQVFDQDQDIEMVNVGSSDIINSGLPGFDAIVVPGGRSRRQALSLEEAGREAIRYFVRNGGGYLGICGGAYLACSDHTERLGLVDAHPLVGKIEVDGRGELDLWWRGDTTQVQVEIIQAGELVFGCWGGKIELPYHNGPIFVEVNLDRCTVLAYYRTEVIDLEEQRGTMVNSPAIISASFGQGRALIISPHPEQDPNTSHLVSQAVDWITRS